MEDEKYYDEKFLNAFNYMLENEGGFANEKYDKGGATKYGVSQSLMREMYKHGSIWLDLHRDGIIDEKDVEKLTLEDVKTVYYVEFWKKGIDRIATIHENIGIKLFDMAVNIGIPEASKMLQKSLNELAIQGGVLKVDGVIGPETLELFSDYISWQIYDETIDTIEHCLISYLIEYYRAIINKDSTQKKFWRGWMNRAFKMP